MLAADAAAFFHIFPGGILRRARRFRLGRLLRYGSEVPRSEAGHGGLGGFFRSGEWKKTALRYCEPQSGPWRLSWGGVMELEESVEQLFVGDLSRVEIDFDGLRGPVRSVQTCW